MFTPWHLGGFLFGHLAMIILGDVAGKVMGHGN